MKIRQRLERELSNFLGLKNVVLFSSCRNALYTLLLSLNLKRDDEIIVQKFICDSVPNAVKEAGGKPVLVEVNEETFNLDPKLVENEIDSKTKAIIFVHTYGNPSGILEIKNLCDKYGLILIEDIAHALGASYDGRLAGTFGDYAVYSFTKQMVNFGGGALITNHEIKEIEKLRNQLHNNPSFFGYFKKLMASLYETRAFFLSKWLIDLARKKNGLKRVNKLDHHFHCTIIEAFLAYKQIKCLKEVIEKKKINFEYVQKMINTQKVEGAQSSYNYISIICSNKEESRSLIERRFLFSPAWAGSNVSDRLVFLPNSPHFNKKNLNYFLKKNEDKLSIKKNNTKAVLLALLCTIFISIAQILLKLGSDNFTLSLNQAYNFPLLGGVALYFMGAVILVHAFRWGELSVIYPLTASSYVVVALLSIFFLDEMILLKGWFSFSLITAGVVLVGVGGKSES